METWEEAQDVKQMTDNRDIALVKRGADEGSFLSCLSLQSGYWGGFKDSPNRVTFVYHWSYFSKLLLVTPLPGKAIPRRLRPTFVQMSWCQCGVNMVTACVWQWPVLDSGSPPCGFTEMGGASWWGTQVELPATPFTALWFCHPVAVDLWPLQSLPDPEKLILLRDMRLIAPTFIQNLRRVRNGCGRIFLCLLIYSVVV